jgi:hypothetical protein
VQLDSVHHATLSILGAAQTLLGGGGEYGVDTDGDGDPDLDAALLGPFSGATLPSQLAVAWTPAGRVAGVFCRGTSTTSCDVEYRVDGNANFQLQSSEATVIQSVAGTEPRLWSPSLAYDATGRAVVGYSVVASSMTVFNVRVAHDLDGDGQWSTSERVLVETALGRANAGKVAIDPGGRVAYAYGRVNASTHEVRVAYDRSGDRDFGDTVGGTPELFTAATLAGSVDCVGAAFDPAGRLAVVFDGPSDQVTLLRDLDGDGAFAGLSETQVLETLVNGSGCDVAGSATGPLAVAYRGAGNLVLRVDRDANGVFSGVDEFMPLASNSPDNRRVAVALNPAGVVFVADGSSAGGQIYVDPAF